MRSIIIIISILALVSVCSGDQVWWDRLFSLICVDSNGNRIDISDSKLNTIRLCDIGINKVSIAFICRLLNIIITIHCIEYNTIDNK